MLLTLLVNVSSLLFKKRSLLEAAATHQRRFAGVSKGGVFLSNEKKFIRLNYDTSQIKRVTKDTNKYTIRKDVSYMYWQPGYPNDTLYSSHNEDTTTDYQLVYTIKPGKSNVSLPVSNPVITIGACFYYTLFYPMFFNANGFLQLVASVENLLVLLALLIIFTGLITHKKDRYLPAGFLIFALALCLLIGFSAPNSGAIFRYRSPAMLFLLLAALYFIPMEKLRFRK